MVIEVDRVGLGQVFLQVLGFAGSVVGQLMLCRASRNEGDQVSYSHENNI